MKWSELPQEYQDLEKHFDRSCGVDREQDTIDKRFTWNETPQGWTFWKLCHYAYGIKDLPPITKTHHEIT